PARELPAAECQAALDPAPIPSPFQFPSQIQIPNLIPIQILIPNLIPIPIRVPNQILIPNLIPTPNRRPHPKDPPYISAVSTAPEAPIHRRETSSPLPAVPSEREIPRRVPREARDLSPSRAEQDTPQTADLQPAELCLVFLAARPPPPGCRMRRDTSPRARR